MNFDVVSPNTTQELLKTIHGFQGKNFRLGAGYTDLILELRKESTADLTLVNLARLKDEQFQNIEKLEHGIRLGAMVTASMVLSDSHLTTKYPSLFEAAEALASRQIRQVATIGGNLCTASPSGDISCALLALDAKCEILNTANELRIVPLRAFFTGVRSTVLLKHEILRSVIIPDNDFDIVHSGFIKIGTRRSMECSVVSLGYHIQIDSENIIRKAGLAIGSAAPTILFPASASQYLVGKPMPTSDELDMNLFAEKVVSYANPISDIRGTAWYRKQVLFNISESMFA